jgi:hypothetical protein
VSDLFAFGALSNILARSKWKECPTFFWGSDADEPPIKHREADIPANSDSGHRNEPQSFSRNRKGKAPVQKSLDSGEAYFSDSEIVSHQQADSTVFLIASLLGSSV